jgi:fumarylpyruvate hydrolase
MSKGFDLSAVVGLIHRQTDLADGTLTLQVDGIMRQTTLLSKMIWDVPGIIAHLSCLVTLAPGDLIFTGTPAGVGALQRGQTCTVTIDGLSPASVTIA